MYLVFKTFCKLVCRQLHISAFIHSIPSVWSNKHMSAAICIHEYLCSNLYTYICLQQFVYLPLYTYTHLQKLTHISLQQLVYIHLSAATCMLTSAETCTPMSVCSNLKHYICLSLDNWIKYLQAYIGIYISAEMLFTCLQPSQLIEFVGYNKPLYKWGC